MELALKIIGGWFALSVPFGIIVGKCLKAARIAQFGPDPWEE